ncbi:MAG: GxxExxY protein [Limisphaerales bacterium]
MRELEQAEPTGRIIGCAIAVHRELGPGFLESVYEAALAVEFGRRGLSFERQKLAYISYPGVAVDEHRLDYFIDDLIVAERKATAGLEDIHFAVARFSLKAVGREHGLFLNFATLPLTVKRVIRDSRQTPSS